MVIVFGVERGRGKGGAGVGGDPGKCALGHIEGGETGGPTPELQVKAFYF